MAEIEVNGPKGFVGAKLSVNKVKYFVLVSGIDYHDLWSFDKYAKKEKEKILKTRKIDEDFIFLQIDILIGKINKHEYIGKNPLKTTTEDFEKIEKSDFTGHSFTNTSKNIISKSIIYKKIEEIGKTNPNSVFEIHVFSHAYWNGPILVNSDSSDPNDKDMRKNDFSSGVISISDFKKSLNKDAIFKIWGCSFPKSTNFLFSRLRKAPKLNTATIPADTDVIEYSKGHFDSTEYDIYDEINSILSTSFGKSDKKTSLTYLQIKKILALNYLSVFAAYAAKKLETKAIAALPATYAEITPEFHIASITIENVKFYKKHLNISTDDKNYGIYDVATITRLEAI